MGIVFGLIAAAIGIAVTLAAAAERRRARVQSWQRAAQRAGLSNIEEDHGGLFRGGWLRGRSGPLEVRLEKRQDGAKDQAVTVLARELPEHPATREALLAARRDPSREVRLRAAAALGAEGRETLLELVANDATDDPTAAGAVRALTESGAVERGEASGAGAEDGGLAPQEVEKELRRALARRREETALACIEALARRSRPESESLLLQTMRMGGARLAVAAASALGQVGTAAAIAPLRKAAAPLWSGEAGNAARQAIAAIRARLTGAAPGQLSLAGGDAGALSLAQGKPGQLSLSGGGAAVSALAELAANERRLGIPGAAGSGAGGDDEPDGFESPQPARQGEATWS